jgi:hypothetical protein
MNLNMPTEVTAAILGSLVGAFITYRFALSLVNRQHELSNELADREALRLACGRFRASFAPTQAFIYIAQKHGTHDRPDVDAHVKELMASQGAAVEEFRPHVKASDLIGYQQAWKQYRATVASDSGARTAEEWGAELRPDELLEKHLSALVRYAEI